MATVQDIRTGFTAGWLGWALDGRIDLNWQRLGCRELENFIVMPQGPAARRGGSKYIAAQGNEAAAARLIGFVFKREQAYMLEFGANAIRVFKDQGQVVADATDAAIANGTFDSDLAGWTASSVTWGATGVAAFAAGGTLTQAVTVSDPTVELVIRFRVGGWRLLDELSIRVGTSSGGQQVLADQVKTPGWHTVQFTPGSGNTTVYVQFRQVAGTPDLDDVAFFDDEPIEIATDYTQDRLAAISTKQTADVLHLCHAEVWASRLARLGHATWSLTQEPDTGPYFDENTDAAKTLQPSATSGSVTVTAAGHAPFVAGDVGRLVRIKHSTTWGYGVITAYSSATSVTVRTVDAFNNTTAVSAWQLGLYSDTTGHPAAVAFHQSRRALGGATETPSRFDLSASGDFNVLTPGSEDDEAIAYTIAHGLDDISWLASRKVFLVGTQGAEHLVRPDNLNGPLTPSNVGSEVQTEEGSAPIRPLTVGTSVLFVDRHTETVHIVNYDFEQDTYASENATARANDIAAGGLTDWAYARYPFKTTWAVRADGWLLSLGYDRLQEVLAWGLHTLGGPGYVEAVATIPGTREDEVWLTVRRTIDGATRRYIEVLQPPLRITDPPEDAWHVDAALKLDNTIAATLTPGATSGDGVPVTAGSGVFVAGDIGRWILYRYRVTDGVGRETYPPEWRTAAAEIVGYTSATEVSCDIPAGAPFPSTDTIAAAAWRMTVTAVGGLDHLEGETLEVSGDGAWLDDAVVTGGVLALSAPAATVIAGKSCPAWIAPARLEAGAQAGTAQGRKQRVARAVLRLWRSSVPAVGQTRANMEAGLAASPQVAPTLINRPTPRRAEHPMDAAVPLFTGDREVTITGGYDLDAPLTLRSEGPLPLTVVAIMPLVKLNEG